MAHIVKLICLHKFPARNGQKGQSGDFFEGNDSVVAVFVLPVRTINQSSF
jgi:hypothetical protein